MKVIGSELRAAYISHVLTDGTCARILQKEAHREYPLDRLNDLRALINYAPYFLHQLTSLNQKVDLTSWLEKPLYMSISRCVRTHMAILLALGIAARTEAKVSNENIALTRLWSLELLKRLTTFPLSDRVDLPTAPSPIWVSDKQRSDPLVRLYLKIRELADRLGYGEHPLYSLTPNIQIDVYTIVRQGFFYQRIHECFPHCVLFGFAVEGECSISDISPFRGVLELRAGTAKIFWELFCDGSPVETTDDICRLEQLATSALITIFQQQKDKAPLDLELLKMSAYSTEISELSHLSGKSWSMPAAGRRSIMNEQISSKLGSPECPAYSKLFVDLIWDGLTYIEPLI